MLCAVYKSSRKAETYLFINKKECFDDVPEQLLLTFGKPELVMLLPLNKKASLAGADISKVRHALAEQGYYLQLPPPRENLLKSYRESQGLNKV